MTTRDADFSPAEKTELARRAGWRCSYPGCGLGTVGPGRLDSDAAITMGKAAHITAASEGGPRYVKEMGPATRKSAIQNGFWACSQHADMIDKNDGRGYTAVQLHHWRSQWEESIRRELETMVKATTLAAPFSVEFDQADPSCLQNRYDHPQPDLQLRIRVINNGEVALKEVKCFLVERRPHGVPGYFRVINDNDPPYEQSNAGIRLASRRSTYFDVVFNKLGSDQIVFEYADNYLRNVEQWLNPMIKGVYYLTFDIEGVRDDDGTQVVPEQICIRLDANDLPENMTLEVIPCDSMPSQFVAPPRDLLSARGVPNTSASVSAVFASGISPLCQQVVQASEAGGATRPQSPASPNHAAMLRRVAEAIKAAVVNNGRCRYADGDNSSQHLRESFRCHFPSIVPDLDAWDNALDAETDTHGRIASKLITELARLGMDRAPWNTGAISGTLLDFAVARQQTNTAWPSIFHWNQYSGSYFWGDLNPNHLVMLAVGSAQEQRDRCNLFERFVNMMLTWPEVQAVRPAFIGRIAQGSKLETALDAIILRDTFYGQCPLCDRR